MLERILLAVITTFCIYLFLNLSDKSSEIPTVNAQSHGMTKLVNRMTSWSW